MLGRRNRKGDLKDVFSLIHAKEVAGAEGIVVGAPRSRIGTHQGWETPRGSQKYVCLSGLGSSVSI